jgi:hydrogenase-4 component B
VLHATGTRELDRLGGLWRRMPATGLAFLIGAVAICGLPPLNGLVSELLVYLGLVRAGAAGGGPWIAAALAAPALALIGGLALACFVKVFGAIFLGQPRGPAGAHAGEAPPAMLAPMAILAAGCGFIALGAPLVGRVLDQAAAAWAGPAAPPALAAIAPLGFLAASNAGLLLGVGLVGAWLAARARRRAVPAGAGTWDCGYAAPAPRMQYTSSSFAELLVGIFGWALRPRRHGPDLVGPFPAAAGFHSHVPDIVLDRAIVPGFGLAGRIVARLRPIQQGSLHLYLVYILLALFALLVWR